MCVCVRLCGVYVLGIYSICYLQLVSGEFVMFAIIGRCIRYTPMRPSNTSKSKFAARERIFCVSIFRYLLEMPIQQKPINTTENGKFRAVTTLVDTGTISEMLHHFHFNLSIQLHSLISLSQQS